MKKIVKMIKNITFWLFRLKICRKGPKKLRIFTVVGSKTFSKVDNMDFGWKMNLNLCIFLDFS